MVCLQLCRVIFFVYCKPSLKVPLTSFARIFLLTEAAAERCSAKKVFWFARKDYHYCFLSVAIRTGRFSQEEKFTYEHLRISQESHFQRRYISRDCQEAKSFQNRCVFPRKPNMPRFSQNRSIWQEGGSTPEQVCFSQEGGITPEQLSFSQEAFVFSHKKEGNFHKNSSLFTGEQKFRKNSSVFPGGEISPEHLRFSQEPKIFQNRSEIPRSDIPSEHLFFRTPPSGCFRVDELCCCILSRRVIISPFQTEHLSICMNLFVLHKWWIMTNFVHNTSRLFYFSL